jgi:hypothetical protein
MRQYAPSFPRRGFCVPVAFIPRLGDGRAMRRLGHLALILCLVLTGIGLGAARGTVVRAEQIVLCTGHGVVVVDHPDGPPRAQICPDMALSLLSALPDALVGLALWRHAADLDRPVPGSRAQGCDSPRPAARGPPVPQFFDMKAV